MTAFNELNTKTARAAHIRKMVSCDARWAVRALVRIYEHQTDDEQRVGETREHNGVGFTGADANILSSFAEQVQRGRQLSEKQMRIVFKRMPKYARQLERISK
jgi:hypothetical protein